MVDEVLPELFRIEVPLPENPLRSINVYVARGVERSLIVDTGMNRAECRAALSQGLRTLGIDAGCADIFVTHLHADHIGLAKAFARPGTTVFLSRTDRVWLEAWTGWEAFFPLAEAHGVPVPELKAEIASNPSLAFEREWLPEVSPVDEGRVFAVGDYRFECVETPGHTPGHMCLYEPRAKVLLSGDHILGDISPNITTWLPGRNPLKEYLDSLEKASHLEVDLVLPGHRRLFRDHRARIAELQVHHWARLDEVLALLSRRFLTAFELASEMTWDLKGSWASWPLAQKWFATGEAMAHLVYLEAEGAVVRDDGDRIVFSRCSPSACARGWVESGTP
ncbi:MAG: MBL fold metallo-hydrolase [Deltaproteobacteria bacterium]|nr:MBL fold metallo-hydrolase [Deltaproteobacteria bacterium]